MRRLLLTLAILLILTPFANFASGEKKVEVRTNKSIYKIGEPIEVTVKNIGDDTLYCFDPAFGEVSHDLYWQIFDESGGAIGTKQSTAPGAILEPNSTYIWYSYTFNPPDSAGKYLIRVFYDGEPIGQAHFSIVR